MHKSASTHVLDTLINSLLTHLTHLSDGLIKYPTCIVRPFPCQIHFPCPGSAPQLRGGFRKYLRCKLRKNWLHLGVTGQNIERVYVHAICIMYVHVRAYITNTVENTANNYVYNTLSTDTENKHIHKSSVPHKQTIVTAATLK